MLRVFAMLASNVVSTFQMRRRRPPVLGTRAVPASLPGEKIDTLQETQSVAASDHACPTALVTVGCAKVLADEVPSSPGVLKAVRSLGLARNHLRTIR